MFIIVTLQTWIARTSSVPVVAAYPAIALTRQRIIPRQRFSDHLFGIMFGRHERLLTRQLQRANSNTNTDNTNTNNGLKTGNRGWL